MIHHVDCWGEIDEHWVVMNLIIGKPIITTCWGSMEEVELYLFSLGCNSLKDKNNVVSFCFLYLNLYVKRKKKKEKDPYLMGSNL